MKSARRSVFVAGTAWFTAAKVHVSYPVRIEDDPNDPMCFPPLYDANLTTLLDLPEFPPAGASELP